MDFSKHVFVFSSLFLFLIIVLGSLNYFIYNKSFYYDEYQKNGVYGMLSENRTYAKEYVEDVTNNIFRFLKGNDELKYFTEEEKSHMDDVKQVFNMSRIVYYFAVVLFIISFAFMYFKNKNTPKTFIQYIARTTFWGGWISIIFLAVLLLMSIFYFDLTFMLLHRVLFPQGNWMFPAESLLITLFPQQFFFDITLKIFVFAFVQSIVFLLIGVWLRKQLRIRKNLR